MDRNITAFKAACETVTVALRKEGVDRNITAFKAACEMVAVALRKEGVDRNMRHTPYDRQHLVALRKEGVDRNQSENEGNGQLSGRPP